MTDVIARIRCPRCQGYGMISGFKGKEQPYTRGAESNNRELGFGRNVATQSRGAKGCPKCEGKGTISERL